MVIDRKGKSNYFFMEPFDIRIYQAFKKFFNESFSLAGHGVTVLLYMKSSLGGV